ncbi:Protein KRI1 protein [Fasciola hepatica]|uniref:Protein KRI1 protein n=1 Tax=Fasciola hepatica TaxID=6192 RepID=A0A4E0RW50_FASHE|nr:Protein KRI1 protein [Fasciola hepatica]
MSRIIHQVRMTVDLSSTSDSSNIGLTSTASEAAQHRMKMTQLRKEFLSNPGVCRGAHQLDTLTAPSGPTASFTDSINNPGVFKASFAFVRQVDTDSQGSDRMTMKSCSPVSRPAFVHSGLHETKDITATLENNNYISSRLSTQDTTNTALILTPVMTSSVPKGRSLSLVDIEHANECATSTALTPPGSKVHVDSMHIESPNTLSQHMFANRSCATCIADWSTACHDSHRSTTELVSSYSPITLHSLSSSPALRHVVTATSCLPVGSLCVPMSHHPSRTYSNETIGRMHQLPYQPLRQFSSSSRSTNHGSAYDSRSAFSGPKKLSFPVHTKDIEEVAECFSPSMAQDRGNINRQNGQRSSGQEMDNQLHKMRATLKDFNAHLSQIDSTLGRMQSCGSLNQYLGSSADVDPDPDSTEPMWNPRHTPSPPSSDHNQSLHTAIDHLSSRSDVGKSFECDTGIVTAHRTTDTGHRTATLSSSLGASLSTLSSSVWSSLSPSVTPANGNTFPAQVPNSTTMRKKVTNNAHAKVEKWTDDLGPSAVLHPSAANPQVTQTTGTMNHPTSEKTREFQYSKFDIESWARESQADALHFVDSSSSSRSYDSGRPTPQSNNGFRPVTGPTEQLPSYETLGRQLESSNRFYRPSTNGTIGKSRHNRVPNAHLSHNASRTASQPSLTADGSGHNPNRTAYSITVVSPTDQRRVIHSSKSFSTSRLPVEDSVSSSPSSGSRSPERPYYSPSFAGSGHSSSPSASDYSADSSQSGSDSPQIVHTSSVNSLIGHLDRLLRTGQEHQARSVIGRLLDTPRSRRKLDCMVAELTSRSCVLGNEQLRMRQSSHRIPNSSSHASVANGHWLDENYKNDKSPTGSLLRLANSLISASPHHPGSRSAKRGSFTSLQSHVRKHDSEYDLSTPNLSDRTRHRSNVLASTPSTQPSRSSRIGSVSSLGRRRILWSVDDMVEQPLPAMRPPPRPTPPSRPKVTVMPTEQILNHLDNQASEVASSFTYTSFTELVRALINDMTDEVHIIRSLFTWLVTLDIQSNEFDPVAPADSLIGMLRRIRCGQLSRNHLLHKLCRYAGIHCQFITGYSKGSAYRPGMPMKNNHLFYCAWLAVHVADGWRFVNVDCAVLGPTERGYCCSASGRSESLLLTDANFPMATVDEFFFLTDPEQYIFHSFPDHKIWQLLRKPITLERFVRLPLLRSAFFNANLSLKKNYGDCLTTTNGQVSIKLLMPQFVGISCSLENCADHSVLRGLCLVEVLHTTDVVRIHVAPSQPGTYYFHVYVAPDWRVEDCRHLACSFQIQCAEHNYSRLVVMGRLPEVGFLGPTPAARTLGVSMCAERSPSGGRALFVHTSSEPLRIPFAIAPGLKICHQLKSFDRPGHQMVDCDSYALLQMRTPKSNSHGPMVNAYYQIRMPIEGFYYLTIYASSNADSDTDHLECVYRILIDVRKTRGSPTAISAFPRQTFWWVQCRLLEPLCQRLSVNRQYTFRLDAPQYDSVAVVINEADWHFLSPTSPAGRWIGKISVGEFLGQLSVFARFARGPDGFRNPLTSSKDEPDDAVEEDDAYVKLLDYLLVE